MATRSVSVKLQADVRNYVSGMTLAAAVTNKLSGSQRQLTKASQDMAAQLQGAGTSVDTLGKGAMRAGTSLDVLTDRTRKSSKSDQEKAKTVSALSAELRAAEANVVRFAQAFTATGDARALAGLRSARKELTELRNLDRALPQVQAGGRSGISVAAGLGSALMQSAPKAGMDFGMSFLSGARAAITAAGPLGLVGAGFAIGAAGVVGTAVGGAIVGGAGIGGVIGGLAIVADDPRVEAAGTKVSGTIAARLQQAAKPFVGEALKALETVDKEAARIQPVLNRIFANSAGFTEPLTDGVLGMIDNLLAGVDKAVAAAQPIIAVVSDHLPQLGDALGDIFGDLSDNALEGAHALDVMFTVVEGGIRGVGMVLNTLAEVYGLIARTGLLGGETASQFILYDVAQQKVGNGAVTAAGQVGALAGKMTDAAAAADSQRWAMEELQRELRAQSDPVFAFLNAQDKVAEAQKRVNKEIKEHGRYSPEAQAAMRALAQESIDLHGTVVGLGDDFDGKLPEALRATLEAAHMTGPEIAEIERQFRAAKTAGERYTGRYGADVEVTNLPEVQGQLDSLRTELLGMPDGNATVNVDTSAARNKIEYLKNNLAMLGGGMYLPPPKKDKAKRWGGVDRAMAAGGIQADVYAASDPPLVQFAEKQTGGEAYVPRLGDPARSKSILDVAAGWYGMRVVPMAVGGVLSSVAARSGLVNVAPKPVTNTRTGTRLESDQAYLSARDSLASFNTAIKENGRSLSVSTAKGRENRRALYDAIGAAQAAARAKYEETGSVQQANEAYRLHIDRLKGTLTQQKVNASEASKILAAVAGPPKYDTPEPAAPRNSSSNIAFVKDRMAGIEAEQKAREFFDPSWGKPTFSAYTATGRDDLNALFDYLAAAEAAAQARYAQTGNASQATSLYNQSLFTLRGILNKAGMSKAEIDKLFASYGQITLKANRMGGLYEHAQTGLLRDAHIAGAGQTLYAYAEPATGGELFAPKYGNLQKTKEQVGWAVQNWWGGQNPWQPSRGSGSGGGGKTVVVNATIPIQLGNETIVRTVRFEVDTALGALADAQIYATAG